MKLPYILIAIAGIILIGVVIKIATGGMGGSLLADSIMNSKNQNAELENLGPAPEFVGIHKWLNSQALTMAELKGKVVLIDFWTYSCINCIRTLPYVTKWYDTYKDQGFVTVGVHTPEFDFEKVTSNVETAIKRHNINYPVAQDNDFSTWQAYNNRYWPAHYLIDKSGDIVYTHFGEGKYDETENAIRTLLGLEGGVAEQSDVRKPVRTPEIYFGTDRLENLVSNQAKFINQETLYQFPADPLPLNTFALEGSWEFSKERAILAPGSQGSGKIRLHFSSGKLFMVAAAGVPTTLKITVDGKTQPDVTVSSSQLYTLFDSEDYTDHILEIEIPESGFEAFTFTFG